MIGDNIFSSIEEARNEVHRRWNDQELKNRVRNLSGCEIPDIFLESPKAVIARQLATPNREFKVFMDKSASLELPAVDFEFLDDRFVTVNRGKALMGKMRFYERIDVVGNVVTSNKHIIDLSGCNEGKKLKEIETLWGENFVHFHHRLLGEFFKVTTFDGSDLYKEMSKGDAKANLYYPHYLALLAINHVLFDDFPEEERGFYENVFLPAFQLVEKEIGVKPIIVPIASEKTIEDKYWWHYPPEVKNFI